jgi:heat shock protein HslJ/Tol biopolymer transport system component
MKIKIMAVTLMVVLLTVACSQTSDPPQGDPILLDGTSWMLLALNNQTLLPGTAITAAFSEAEVTGHSGCNSYFGSYAIDGSALEFGAIGMTAMACLEPERVMEQEVTYLEILGTVTEARLSDGQLDMLDESGETVLRFERQEDFEGDPADLAHTEWELHTLDGNPLDSSLPFTIAFAGDRYSGLAGCRHYEGAYDAGDGTIRFIDITMLEEDCPGAESDYYTLEGQFTDSLTWARHWRIVDGRLEIRTQRGEILFFEPAPPTETTPSPEASQQANLPVGLIYSNAQGLWRVEVDGLPLQLSHRLDGTLSPAAMRGDGDGRAVLFHDISGASDDTDIWILDLSTGEERNLTGEANRRECCPQWWPSHPDVIVFGSWPADYDMGPSTGYLTVIRTDGSGYRVLDEMGESNALPAPAPDGEAIAYDQGGSPWLYRWNTGPVRFDPTQYQFSAPQSMHMGSPAWSPDGNYLAWVVGGEFGQGWRIAVAIFDLRTGTSWLIHPYEPFGVGGWPAGPVWSPDGEWLAYNLWPAADPAERGLWVFSVDGELEWLMGEGGPPIWSPDGQFLLFGTQSGVWMAEAGTWDRVQVNVPTGATVVGWVEVDPGLDDN